MSDIEDFEKAKKELHKEENAMKVYNAQNSIKAGVLSIIPFLGSLLDKLSDQAFDKYQSNKRQMFVDTVLANKALITSDMVRNEACIINIAKTIELVDRCATADKVVYFGNLVRNGYFDTSEQISNDDFDEYAAILNELSYREIQYLIEFASYARANGNQLSGKALNDYCNRMISLFPKTAPLVALNRLQRTGFITDQMAWVDLDTDMQADGTLQLGAGKSFTLDSAYDDFERMVLSIVDGSM